MEKSYALKGQSLENGLSCMFRAIGNILLQKEQNQHDSAQKTEHRVRAQGTDLIWSQTC